VRRTFTADDPPSQQVAVRDATTGVDRCIVFSTVDSTVKTEAAGPTRPLRLAWYLPILLTSARFVLAPGFVLAVVAARSATPTSAEPGAWWPLACALTAAGTDFADGRLARRLGVVSRAGSLLDVLADATFILASFAALAAAGLVSRWAPVAAAASLAAFALSRARGRSPGGAMERGIADRIGHAAGVVNYGLVLGAASVPVGLLPSGFVFAASLGVAALNLAPLALRARSAPRPPSPPGEETRPRSARW
jgi:phosphatidylglycerophosphate synthase